MRRGFTLIELLIVIAIILILLALALPNFLEARTRAKTLKVTCDHRVISQALECYFLDFWFYPLRASVDGSPSGLNNLTTPVCYLENARRRDPFPHLPFYPYYRYWPVKPNGYVQATTNAHNRDSNCYLLSSNGPEGYFTAFAGAMRAGPERFAETVYAPTNGVFSAGNIWWLGGYVDGVVRQNVMPVLPATMKAQ